MRACDRCGWFFIDSSRGRRRRWCSMKTCGNQAKAARYRSSRPG
nr:CGNR zinc finger domain-containing protein [Streptomyces marincola]